MAARSAGILIHRHDRAGLAVLLIHPGGPFWRNKDAGAWQIPKGGIEPGETSEMAARREVAEELGLTLTGPLQSLGEVRQAGGKTVEAFTCAADFDPATIVSATFELEWPPRSGRIGTFPEVDEARWFAIADAPAAMLLSQRPLLDRLIASIGGI